MADNDSAWYSVRTIIRFPHLGPTYEERVTLWRASSFDEAIVRAEEEGLDYCRDLDAEWCGLVQAFLIGVEPLEAGSEVFSLMRDSDLDADAYVDSFFDTGAERQRTVTEGDG